MSANNHTPTPSPYDIRATGLDDVVRTHLRPLAWGLLPLYAAYAIGHVLLLPSDQALPMTILAGVTAVLLLALNIALLRWEPPLDWVHPFGVLLGGLVMVNSLAHIAVTGDPKHTTNLLLLLVGAAVLLLRWRWLLALMAATWTGWLAVMALAVNGGDWSHFVFGLLAATVLALIVHSVRLRTLYRLERLHQIGAQQAAAMAAAASEIRQSEERFRRLANAAFEALVFHKDGCIVDMNQSALELFGCSLEEARTKTVWDLVAPESYDVIRERIASPDAQPYEVAAQRNDGSRFPAEVHVRVLPSEGRTLRVVAARDITARKQMEDEREQLIAELDSFAHTVAHDLKGPLSLIVSYAQMLEKEGDLLTDEEKATFINQIAEGSIKLDTIIDELLLLAQVRHGDVKQHILPMDDIVMNVCRRVMPLQHEAGATIEPAETWPQAVGYGPWIEEVWYNYVCNAIKYGGDPPEITLGATPQPDGTVRFWVRDNGTGLTQEEQAQIFQPFNRLNHVGTKGYGLGLSIVQRIMERLGGAVGVDSIPGDGSEFYFTLPTAESEAVPADPNPVT